MRMFLSNFDKIFNHNDYLYRKYILKCKLNNKYKSFICEAINKLIFKNLFPSRGLKLLNKRII